MSKKTLYQVNMSDTSTYYDYQDGKITYLQVSEGAYPVWHRNLSELLGAENPDVTILNLAHVVSIEPVTEE